MRHNARPLSSEVHNNNLLSSDVAPRDFTRPRSNKESCALQWVVKEIIGPLALQIPMCFVKGYVMLGRFGPQLLPD